MEAIRKPFQGVWNIIQFNWHFYLLSIVFVLLMVGAAHLVNPSFKTLVYILAAFAFVSTVISLAVSFYIYDVSSLYKLTWLDGIIKEPQHLIVNINAGFDETSILLQQKFPRAQLTVLDFYNPKKHTEVSIKRARKAYPAFTGTQQTTTTGFPLNDNTADSIFVILAAHEIRNKDERTVFFKELKRVVKPNGQIIVTEHIRDIANFTAFNIGFFHFYADGLWRDTFYQAGLNIQQQIKITPFISTFILTKNADMF
jgi:ubiquinone/menaquinone biosynthesis C-methylase UbiE